MVALLFVATVSKGARTVAAAHPADHPSGHPYIAAVADVSAEEDKPIFAIGKRVPQTRHVTSLKIVSGPAPHRLGAKDRRAP